MARLVHAKPELDLPWKFFNDPKPLDHLSIKGSGTNSTINVNGSCMKNLVFAYGYETDYCIAWLKALLQCQLIIKFIISCRIATFCLGLGLVPWALLEFTAIARDRRDGASPPFCPAPAQVPQLLSDFRIFVVPKSHKKKVVSRLPLFFWVHLSHCWTCKFMLWWF